MAVEKLTEKIVRNAAPPASGNYILYERQTPGFGLRITAAKAKAFVLTYRVGGQQRRATIGSWPIWTVTAAREQAKSWRRRIDGGEDPLRRRQEERAAPTIADLVADFVETHLPKRRASTQVSYKSILMREIPKSWRNRKVADFRFEDIERLHGDITKSGRTTRANRTVAVLSKMFSHARRKAWIADNPCKGVERNPENKRRRYLKGEEVIRLVEALRSWRDQRVANAVRFCMLTGCRKGEAVTARWRDMDFERGVWVKPAATTKAGEVHEVPLSPPALQLLSEIHAEAKPDELVFPARNGGPQEYLSNAWADIAKAARLEGVRLHDLRHSYASFLVSRGASLPLIGALLGHATPATTSRYAHLYDDALRKATDSVGDYIAGVASGGMAVVTPMPTRRRT